MTSNPENGENLEIKTVNSEEEKLTGQDLENLKRDMKNAVKVRGEGELSWAYFQCMTPINREEFDAALVEAEHPLAYEAGTTWGRFQKFIMGD